MEDKQQEELLILYGAKFAVSQMQNMGGDKYGRKNTDGKWETVKWDAICKYLDDKIDELKMNWKL